MRITISDPELVPDLLAFLDQQLEIVAARLGETEVEVSLIGSHRIDAMRMELDLQLALWRAKHPGVAARVSEPA
jgi:hypothetical protein